jgi:hypothetical protein
MATETLQYADLRQSTRYLDVYKPPQIDGDFTHKHIISVDQFDRRDLQILFDATASIRKRIRQHDRGLLQLCAGYLMATLFYEARTWRIPSGQWVVTPT